MFFSFFFGRHLHTTFSSFADSYFKKTTVHVRTIRNVKPGEQLTENYGPLYSQNPKDERCSKLKKFYWFDCNCEACEQNWPVFGDMTNNEMRFKCNGSESCDNAIVVPENCSDFMIQCAMCGRYSNIMKNLKAVQDTEILEKTAKRLAAEGRTDDALKKYYEMMRIFDTEMVAPFQDYCKCQQAIKECLLEYGNKIQID